MAATPVPEAPRDFNAEIAPLHEELAAAQARLAAVRGEFAAATVQFYHDWYWKRTESAVFEHPEITRGLGRERLGQLKADVRALQETLPDAVAACFPDRMWATDTWHPQESPQALERAASPLAEPLYQILVNYGLERYHGRKIAGPRPNEAMGRLLAEYAELAARSAQIERRLRALNREKEQALARDKERQEIADLWNSA